MWQAFLIGMGSIFDFSGNYFTLPYISDDERALAEDWKKVGQDMYSALEEYNSNPNEWRVL